jgi:DNA-binding GntR family transcriptional regulator
VGKKRRTTEGVKRLVTYGSGRPAYLQLADDLRREILAGRLAPGDKLPSATDLTRKYQVSRQVAVMALRELHHSGLIYGHAGKGTFVRERPLLRRRSTVWYAGGRGSGSPTARSIEAHGGAATWEHESEHSTATADIAARLDIEEGDPVMVTGYTYFADGVPIQLATSWEPLAITGGTPIEWPEEGSPAVGVVDRFDHIGIRITSVDEIVSARTAAPEEQAALNIPTGVPVLAIERTYAAGGRPVETASIIASGDRYELHYGIPVGD